MNHPLVPGTWILSVQGEQDDDYDDSGQPVGEPRRTGPGAIGTVMHTPWHNSLQGWTYSVGFPNGTWVFIDQRDGIDDPAKYRVLYPE
jgi:hypothetical protein